MAYLKRPWFDFGHEIPIAERRPILTAYEHKAVRTVDGYFRTLPDPADHPVFALTATV
jgi:hypothetical protein